MFVYFVFSISMPTDWCYIFLIELDYSEVNHMHWWRITGEGGNYREWLCWIIQCTGCSTELTDGYMKTHCIQLHGKVQTIDWVRLLVIQMDHIPLVYKVKLLTTMHSLQFPFWGCPGMYRIQGGLRNQFIRLHFGGSIIILKEHPTPFYVVDTTANRCPHGY